MSIRVLVASLPRLLTEVLGSAVNQPPEMALAAATPEHVRPGSLDLDEAIATYQPDAAIVGMRPAETAAVEDTVRRHRDVAIVAVSPDATQAWNVELQPCFRRLDPGSPDQIRIAIRQAFDLRQPDEASQPEEGL